MSTQAVNDLFRKAYQILPHTLTGGGVVDPLGGDLFALAGDCDWHTDDAVWSTLLVLRNDANLWLYQKGRRRRMGVGDVLTFRSDGSHAAFAAGFAPVSSRAVWAAFIVETRWPRELWRRLS